MYTTMIPQSQTTSSSPYNGHSPSYYSDQNSGNSSSTSISSPSMYSYSSSSNTSPTSITHYPMQQTMQNNGMVSNIMDFYIHDVNFSLHTKASPECEIQLYRLTNPMDAQITFVNTHPQSTPPPHLSTVVYALQIQLEKFMSQTNQWVPCTNDTPSSNLFKDYEANVLYNQTNNQSITQLIQTDGKSLYIQLPLQLGLFSNQYTSMTFRSKLNTSKEKQGFKRGEVAIFRVVFTLLKQQQQLHTYFQNKYDSVPFGIINHGKNSTAVGMYKNIKLSSIPGTVEYNMLIKQQQQQTYTPQMHSPNSSIYTTPNTSVGTSDYSNNSPYGGNQYSGYNGQSMGLDVIDESRQIQEMLDILNQEEEMARQYYNSNSSNDSGSGDDMMYMTDDEDMFREINSMEDYFSQSQETNTSPGQSDQNYEDIKWEDDPNEDFHGFTTQSDSANVFLCDDECDGMDSYYADYSAPSTQPQSATLSSAYSTLFKSSVVPQPLASSAGRSVERRSLSKQMDSFAPPPPVMRSKESSLYSLPPPSSESRSRSSLGNTIQASITPSINQYETWSSPIVSDSRQELVRSVASQPSQPPRMTFGAHYIRSDVAAELKQPVEEKKKKKLSLGKLFKKKDEKAPKEKENEEKAKNPLSNQSHASFFANFKPSTMVTLNTNQLPENVRQVSKVTQAQQKPTEDSTSTAEDELAETLSKLNINNTALTTKFDPKKITFTLEKKGSKEVYDLTNPSKEKKSIPSFNPGDVIQFSVKNNNEKEFIEKTNLIVGTTIPRRSIVTFSDKSTGFTQMKETVATSQIVQIPNIRVTNPTCKKKAKIVTIVLFVKFIESGKERIFTTKRRIMVVNK
ncbi:hypothetical protein NAEGRDRAFT_59742 [Naegleria gruberi]|uniref:Uncharacterized protein n=1 Tax=Naegleria gruberi TaxID=5762 RepID=D2W094_NAEGR|nr:uncharacterized protein NAEGRDRAFT_59742 [Naegleria gruberi]EFC37535.1 hypothetical protein NAEGRDRAFT_59742 [Naegleria gruberi]|eukprot:XP_002670279.1 hypothetical protein NAEGRDRAFT_59742 [Naegleria gruberi strain NEG-M]